MITQRVNLYLPEFRKKREWLDAARMAQVLSLGLVLLALGGGFEYWRLDQAEQRLAQASERHTAAVNTTQALRARFGSQTPDAELVARNEALQEALDAKRALLQFMTGRQLGNAGGFSEYLSELARFHTAGLSLNTIKLESDGTAVRLEGVVRRAEIVPIYLQRLSQGEVFRGMSFRTLNIDETTLQGDPVLGTEDMVVWSFSVSTLQ